MGICQQSRACPQCKSRYISRWLEKGLCCCNSCGCVWDVPAIAPAPNRVILKCAMCDKPFEYTGEHPGVRMCLNCIALQYSIEPEPEDVEVDVEAPWEEGDDTGQ